MQPLIEVAALRHGGGIGFNQIEQFEGEIGGGKVRAGEAEPRHRIDHGDAEGEVNEHPVAVFGANACGGERGACRIAQVVRLAPDRALASAAVAGGPIRLLAADAGFTSNGEAVEAILYWQADEAVGSSYTVFTQLFDADGSLVAQQDNLPVEGLAPTNTWTPGAVIRDPYRLLPDGIEDAWANLDALHGPPLAEGVLDVPNLIRSIYVLVPVAVE